LVLGLSRGLAARAWH